MSFLRKIAHEFFIRIYVPSLLWLANRVTISSNFKLYKLKAYILRLCLIKVHPSSFIDSGFDCLFPNNIQIGKKCSLGHYNKIWAFSKVRIGDLVQSAIGLTIISGGHRTDNYEPLLENQWVDIEGENWIGANVTILGGVKIGRGSIIGAGALVINDIPAYSIAVGVPAKVIKKRIPSDRVLSPFGYYIPK